MAAPIGGPRFWRRLVSRWWYPSRRMRDEWDERARRDALGHIARGDAASETAFWLSGQRDLDQWILHNLVLPRDAKVLEIGCGLGRLLRPLAERVAYAYGVDISPRMIAGAREALVGKPAVSLEVTRGTLPHIATSSLDFVYSFVVFQHIPSKRAVRTYLEEAARVLRHGGLFRFQVDGRVRSSLLGTDTWLGVWYTLGEITALLENAGFDLLDHWGEGSQYFWLTAERRWDARHPGAHPSAIRFTPDTWNPQALALWLKRQGNERSEDLKALELGERSLRSYAVPFLQESRQLGQCRFLDQLYRRLLGRAPDLEGLLHYARELDRGGSRSYVLDCLLGSEELRRQLRQARPISPTRKVP